MFYLREIFKIKKFINVKNKGQIKVYQVNRIKESRSEDVNINLEFKF